MSGIFFSVGADFDKLRQLRADLDKLKATLQSMDRNADKRAFDTLNRQLQQTQREYNNLAGKLSQYVAEQNAANKATQNTASGLGSMQSMLLKIGGTTALIGLGKQVMDVRNEFQQLEISFTTMLKSSEKASALMKDLTRFAAETPFGLQSAASGAKQLLAYGSTADSVIKELTMLGDVAAGTGQQIGDLVYLYGTLRTQGRAYLMDIRQFAGRGIPIYDELAKVLNISKDKVNEFVSAGKVGFEEVEQAFKNMTSQGGLYGGLMEEQSKSIGGRMEALKDNIDSIFNAIGKESEGVIYESIDGINTLIENYDKVGKILVGLVATYGTYRTAVMLNTVAESGWTIAQMTQYRWLLLVEKAQKLLNATILKNPYVLAATLAMGVVSAMWALRDSTTAAEKAINKANDAFSAGEAAAMSEQKELARLRVELERTTVGSEKYNKVKQEIVDKFGKYLPGLDNEITKVDTLATTYDKLTTAIRKSSLARAKDDALKNISEEYTNNIKESLKNIRTVVDNLPKGSDVAKERLYRTLYDAILEGNDNIIDTQTINRLNSLKEKKGKVNKEKFENELKSLSPMNRTLYNNEELYKAVVQAKKDNQKLVDEQTAINKIFPDDLQESGKAAEMASGNFETAAESYNKAAKNYKNAKRKFEGIEANKDLYSNEERIRVKEEYEASKKAFEEAGGKITSDKAAETAAEKARKIAEKKLQSLREIDEADRQRQIDKLEFDNEIRQKSIDNMNDGYDKTIAQLKLNYDKENQSIKEYEQKALKQQLLYAKDLFVSTSGSEKGFEEYFAKVDLSEIMPEGLKPEDIQNQVDTLYNAARASNKKGLDLINKDIARSINEERLQFASEMEQRIYDSQAYFKQRRKDVKAGSDEYFELLSLETKTIESIKVQHNTKLIQMENEYKEKAVELTSELFFFQSDRDAALLKQRIENNKKYMESLKKELKVLTGLDFDTLDESSLDKLSQKYPELVYSIKKAKQEQQGLNNELKKTPAQKLMELSGLFNQISGTLGDITGIDFSILTDAIGGIASFASGDFIGAASSGLSIVSTVVSGIINKKAQQAQIEREILKLQQDYNISLRQQNYDLISSIDYARAFKDNLEALHWLVEKGFISNVDYSVWEEMELHAKKASENVDAARKSYDIILKDAEETLDVMYDNRQGFGRLDPGAKKDIEDWKSGVINSEEALRRLGARGYSGLTDMADKLSRADEETKKWTDSMVELTNQMDQFVTGTEFDGFLSNAMTAITNLKSGVSDLGNFTKDTLKEAVLSSFKYKVLANALEPMYNQLADLFLAKEMDVDAIKDWGVELEKMMKVYADKLGVAYESLGLDFADASSSSQSASKGGYETMSQDTASALEGRFTAIQMSTLNIEGYVKRIAEKDTIFSSTIDAPIKQSPELTAMLTQTMTLNETAIAQLNSLNEIRTIQLNSYYKLSDIEKHTQELYPMRQDLSSMNRKLDSL